MRFLMKRLLALAMVVIFAVSGFAQSFINSARHDGHEISCCVPGNQHIGNVGSSIPSYDARGRRFYAGMCVPTSIEMAALYSGLEQMRGFRDWWGKHYEGGGWPAQVDAVLQDYFEKNSIAPIPYLQYVGKDPEKVLDLCQKAGRMAGMTYNFSPRYEKCRLGLKINHMVNSVLFDQIYGVALDNNFPGENSYEWSLRDEFLKRTVYSNGSSWIFVWMHPEKRSLKKKAG